MANVQKENGFTGIANELLEAIISAGLNGTELAVLLHIARKTYGYNKLSDAISFSQFEKALPYTRRAIAKALKVLQLVNIITLVNKGTSVKIANTYQINKDYEKWELVNKGTLVNKRARTSEQKGNQLVNKGIHTKENYNIQYTKETTTKAEEIFKTLSLPKDFPISEIQNLLEKYPDIDLRDVASKVVGRYTGRSGTLIWPTFVNWCANEKPRARGKKKVEPKFLN